MDLDHLGFLETVAACNFFRAMRGLDVRGKWETADLENLRVLLTKWANARYARVTARVLAGEG